jgi:hypothetical protein
MCKRIDADVAVVRALGREPRHHPLEYGRAGVGGEAAEREGSRLRRAMIASECRKRSA